MMLVIFLTASCAHFSNKDQAKEKAKLYLQMAVDQLSGREFAKAIDSTHEALKFDPSMAAGYNHLALIYMETKRYQKSEEAFRKALELQPDYPEVFNNLGVLMNRLERYKEAITCFEKALTNERYLTPENALTNMG
ncbi:MAG: tetratricopeptide repeat protein, partial [Deltaproteobacteria bacterium]|nr:tetratricopeptide repeat protein [Deltaproteobacteria bacterium]